MIAGVDLGIRKIAISVFDETKDELVDVISLEMAAGRHRANELAALSTAVKAMVYTHKVDTVIIEAGVIGNNRQYSISLAQTAGAVLSQLWQVGVESVLMANVSSWKKEIIGNGKANKIDVSSWLTQNMPAYAERCESQDEVDAVCIGLYGLLLTRRLEAKLA